MATTRLHSGIHPSYCVIIAAQQRTSGLIIHEYGTIIKHLNLYKIKSAVVILHQALRQGRNYRDRHKIIGRRHEIPLGSRRHRRIDFVLLAGETTLGAPARSGQGGVMMELRTRLNVLAAVISFAFLTAVVFGMF
jgi:hypothetical protein